MRVTLLKYPTEEDWIGCKQRALVTVGLNAKTPPDEKWKCDMLRARHSPIRYLQFSFLLEDIPSYVSVHLVRHIHAQPYVKSQRNDRQSNYDRNKAPQDAPVNMIWDMGAEELMTIMNKRLCGTADKTTQQVAKMMRDEVLKVCPEFKEFLVPMCVYLGGECREIFPCEATRND